MQLRCARSPERTVAALQVQQSPRSSTCPTHYAESVGVVVESRGRIALALAQRENSTVGSPKSAVSPRPPRRNSCAARTAPFSEPGQLPAPLSARTVYCRGRRLSGPCVEPRMHVRPGLRFVQGLASCSSLSPSSCSPPARALQLAPSFLRDEAGCMRRSHGCIRRLHWSRPSWFCFAPTEVTIPTWACLQFRHCQASRPVGPLTRLPTCSKSRHKPHSAPHRHAEAGKTR